MVVVITGFDTGSERVVLEHCILLLMVVSHKYTFFQNPDLHFQENCIAGAAHWAAILYDDLTKYKVQKIKNMFFSIPQFLPNHYETRTK